MWRGGDGVQKFFTFYLFCDVVITPAKTDYTSAAVVAVGDKEAARRSFQVTLALNTSAIRLNLRVRRFEAACPLREKYGGRAT